MKFHACGRLRLGEDRFKMILSQLLAVAARKARIYRTATAKERYILVFHPIEWPAGHSEPLKIRSLAVAVPYY